MKTQILKNIFKVIALGIMTLGLANCSKDSGGGSSNNQYVMQGNMCYRVVNGQYQQEYNTSLCYNNQYNNGNQYVMQNGMCYRVQNGQYFQEYNTSLCYNNNGGINNGQITQVCSGYYNDGMRTALCTPGANGIQYQGQYLVMNCSGYTLYNQQGQIVRCQ